MEVDVDVDGVEAGKRGRLEERGREGEEEKERSEHEGSGAGEREHRGEDKKKEAAEPEMREEKIDITYSSISALRGLWLAGPAAMQSDEGTRRLMEMVGESGWVIP